MEGRNPVGLNPHLRVYRYAVGEVFGAHYDDSAETSLGRTELTLLCYLTGKNKPTSDARKNGGAGGGEAGGDEDHADALVGIRVGLFFLPVFFSCSRERKSITFGRGEGEGRVANTT